MFAHMDGMVQGSVALGGRGALQVRAARVGGVDIPNQKRIETALTYVFGIGPTTARAILSDTVRR